MFEDTEDKLAETKKAVDLDYLKFLEDEIEALKRAILTLGKAIPQKPIEHCADKVYTVCSCPSCLLFLCIKEARKPCYCNKCGQVIDWGQ